MSSAAAVAMFAAFVTVFGLNPGWIMWLAMMPARFVGAVMIWL